MEIEVAEVRPQELSLGFRSKNLEGIKDHPKGGAVGRGGGIVL